MKPANHPATGEKRAKSLTKYASRNEIVVDLAQNLENDLIILDCCRYFSQKHSTGLLTSDKNLCLAAEEYSELFPV
jgi:hypothetical protein